MSKLIKCKSCSHELSSRAKACPNCGDPVKSPDISKGGCSWLIIIGLGVVAWNYFPKIFNEVKKEIKEEAARIEKIEAKKIKNDPDYLDHSRSLRSPIETYIKASLKAPSTAKFPWDEFGVSHRQYVTRYKGQTYKVSAWVDSQNGFGATLRQHFDCVFKYQDNKWVLESLAFK